MVSVYINWLNQCHTDDDIGFASCWCLSSSEEKPNTKKPFRRLVCCDRVYTPEDSHVNRRICQHCTTWGRGGGGESEQTKLFSSASIPELFSQTGTDWTASYLAGLSWFPTSRDGWRALAWAANTIALPWKLFMKTLQPLLKRWSGCWAFSVCDSTALSMLYCLPLSCNRPFPPVRLMQTSAP